MVQVPWAQTHLPAGSSLCPGTELQLRKPTPRAWEAGAVPGPGLLADTGPGPGPGEGLCFWPAPGPREPAFLTPPLQASGGPCQRWATCPAGYGPASQGRGRPPRVSASMLCLGAGRWL